MRGTILAVTAVALATLAVPAASAPARLSAADRAAAFRAGGFKLVRGQWYGCADPGSPSYSSGTIDSVRDLNGDGRPEAIIVEGGTYCFGMTGIGYTIVTRQADGTWKMVAQGQGIPNFLATKGIGGWPDIEIGGPGFCFPVERWNGKAYALHRFQYDGKRCNLQR